MYLGVCSFSNLSNWAVVFLTFLGVFFLYLCIKKVLRHWKGIQWPKNILKGSFSNSKKQRSVKNKHLYVWRNSEIYLPALYLGLDLMNILYTKNEVHRTDLLLLPHVLLVKRYRNALCLILEVDHWHLKKAKKLLRPYRKFTIFEIPKVI